MSLRINLNAAAMTAHRTLTGTDNALGKSIERLSSGFKINGAGDDPAGLVISEKMRAQVSGLGQAVRNAGDAVNMVKTAEGALNEVHRLLRSMRDLTLHAANSGVADDPARAADQAQIKNAIESINKIAAETQFGNKRLLDGSAGIKASIVGGSVVTADLSSSGLTKNADIYVDVTTAATHGSMTANKTYAHGTDTLGATGSLSINGVTIEYTSTTTVAGLTSMINGASNATGVTASYTAGQDIELTALGYGSISGRVQVSDSNSVLLSGVTSASGAGADAVAKITSDSGGLNSITDATWKGDGLTLKDSLGNTIMLSETAGTAVANAGKQISAEVGTLVFQVGAYANQTRELNISSTYSRDLGSGVVTNMTLADINVTTSDGAQNAIKILDRAISDVSDIRSTLGAMQKNVLESSINSLNIAKENIAASESTIRDTDMASEMVEFTKMQILQQAGIAMLAQANQAPQALMSLLR